MSGLMVHTLEDNSATFCFHVLRDGDGRRSLWPAFARIPPGWLVVLPAADYRGCLEWMAADAHKGRPPVPTSGSHHSTTGNAR
jgi:uncharacterized protein YbdZ (MbtH family)